MTKLLLPVVLSAALSGCGTASFYWQAINGQWELSRKSQSIEEVIGRPATSAQLRERLRLVQQIRTFASQELKLPDNRSYTKYADIDRPFVVWNVFAAAEFSTTPKEWCFPFAGCVEYRGYFREEAAREFAKRLRERGFDVFVGGVPAYSTLGYLDDPVLNTFIGDPQSEVARLIFHELAHQVVYVKGDSTFNESFASVVELEGVRRWMAAAGTSGAQQAFDQAQARKGDFLSLVMRYREQLGALFEHEMPVQEKRLRKHQLFKRMREDYAKLKYTWGGFSGYDGWFSQALNNAQLASVAIYTQLVPAFQRVLAAQQGDMQRFYAEVERIAGLSPEKRMVALDSGSACWKPTEPGRPNLRCSRGTLPASEVP